MQLKRRTDRSKLVAIKIELISLYPLSFFPNTPFKSYLGFSLYPVFVCRDNSL